MSEPHVVLPAWATGFMTPAQVYAISALYTRNPDGATSEADFAGRAKPLIGGGGCVILVIGAVVYGIEPDGHTHT